jgi:hypothetical protein
MVTRSRPVVGRRSVLLGGLGAMSGTAWALAGCGTGQAPTSAADSSSASPSVGASPSDSTSGLPAETPDRARVRVALDKTEAMLAGLLALRRQVPDVVELQHVHAAHRIVLLDLLDESDGPLPAPPTPALTLAEVPLREAGLQAELVSSALSAENGLVARVLATMSAGIAQSLSTWQTHTRRRQSPSAEASSPETTA